MPPPVHLPLILRRCGRASPHRSFFPVFGIVSRYDL